MANSVSKGIGTAMRTGSLTEFQRYPATTSMRVSSCLCKGLSWFIPNQRELDLKLTHSLGSIVGIVLMSPHFHGIAKTLVDEFDIHHNMGEL